MRRRADGHRNVCRYCFVCRRHGASLRAVIKRMFRLIAVAAFVLAVTTSAQAMPVAPVQTDGMLTQVAYGCGPGMTRVAGVCVARTTKRQVRRCVRRLRWWRYY